MMPGFPIRLLTFVLPAVIAAAAVIAGAVLILALAGGRGAGVFKRQGVAWGLTALMVVAAIGIGSAKALAGSLNPEETPQSAPPAGETVPPGLQQGPGTFPSYVRDGAGVLSDGTERELYERNLRLCENHSAVIGVVTCDYDRDDLYDYAIRRGEAMGLTDYDFIVVLDIRGGVYGMIQGMALVDDFTDDDCARYARDYMEQAFVSGDYDSAVLRLTQALENWYGAYDS